MRGEKNGWRLRTTLVIMLKCGCCLSVSLAKSFVLPSEWYDRVVLSLY